MMGALDRLLRPKSVAVIGGAEAEEVVRQLDLLDYRGDVWPIHPSRTDLGGRPCVPSVQALAGSPDVAFVAVPAAATPPVVAALAAADAGAVVVYSSGFAEAGNRDLQAEVVAAAGAMPLLGPNCYGYVNALDGTAIWPDVHGLHPVGRGVAIVTQSGNIGINLTMARRSLDTGVVITAGNQASLDIAALVDGLLDDGRITAVGVQLESLTDAQAFGRVAMRAAAQRVPLVALKMGTSDRGALVTASHTGAIAGDDDAYDALFARYGIARVRTIPAFLEALKLAPILWGPTRVVSLSASGGEASHVADLAHAAGVDLPELAPEHAAAIAATVDARVAVSNPMDYHTFTWGDEAALTRTFAAVVDGPFDLAMLVLDFPNREVPEDWWTACRAFAAAVGDRSGLVVATLPETMPEAAQERIRAIGLMPMLGVAETIEAIAALGPVPGAMTLHRPGPASLGHPTTLDEAASKAVLAGAGVRVPAGATTADPLAGPVAYPATVKVLGVDHKADVGAVAVGLPDEAALRRALAAMPPGEGYLVEETVRGGLVELLVSLRAMDGLGWMLTICAGGTLVEAIDDRAHLLVPATAADIEAALRGLRVARVLAGTRPGAAADVAAAVAAITALQSLADGAERVIEAEINPLIVTAAGAFAVDAMVTVA